MKKTVDELSKEEVLKIFEKDFSNRLQRKLHSDFWGYFGSPAEKISKPYYTIDFHFLDCKYELHGPERHFIERTLNPDGSMIIPAVDENQVKEKLAIYQRALKYKVKEFFETSEPVRGHSFEDIVDYLPDLTEHCRQRYMNLNIWHNFSNPPVVGYTGFNEKTNSFTIVLDKSKLSDKDKKDISRFSVLGYVSQEPYKHFRKDFSFYAKNIQEPWKKVFHSENQIVKIKVRPEAKSIAEAVLLPIIEKAQGKWDLRAKVSEENQRTLQTLLDAYRKTKEFKEHPQLAEGLEEKLTSVFLSAQEQGIKISLNRYDINAPSRNAVRVQIKQQSKEKEK